jgi:hypothetical protein
VTNSDVVKCLDTRRKISRQPSPVSLSAPAARQGGMTSLATAGLKLIQAPRSLPAHSYPQSTAHEVKLIPLISDLRNWSIIGVLLQISPKLRVWVANLHNCEPYDLRHLIIMVFCTLVQKCTNFALSPLGFRFRAFQGSI